MHNHISFGNWLKQQRKSRDWTQEQLAATVGCSVALIRKYEADDRRPSKQVAAILADRFSIPLIEREQFIAYARGGEAPTSSLLRSSLPPDQTPFIGRKSELDLLRLRLATPECRLLVLTGLGGIGKTRLAIQASREVQPLFPDGVFFLSLVGVDAAEYLVSSIAAALSLAFHSLADLKQQLLHYLRTRKLLLLIDNYEHLLPHTDLVTEVLDTAPNVKIVITSRERLKIQEEWGFPVKGLSYPSQIADDYAEFDTIQLFEQRVAQADADLLLTEADKPFISRICALVQGNPLAIELAAAWTRMLTCQEIAEAIQRNWNFPSSELRNVPDRHRSIHAVFDYSWQRITQADQIAFNKLSIFRGGFSQEAALQIAGVTLHQLANLQDKSFLIRGTSGRYEIHELLRQYGQAKLDEAPEEMSQLSQNFVNYYGKLCQELQPRMWNAEHKHAIDQVKVDLANIRYAWNLATLNTNWLFFNQSVDILWNYFNDTNLFEEGNSLFLRTAEHLTPHATHPTEILSLAWLIHGPAWFTFRLGRLDEAKLLEDRSLTLLDSSGLRDSHIEMMIFGSASFIAFALKDFDEAIKYADKCLTIGEQYNYETALSAGHLFNGMILRGKDDINAAKMHLYQAMRLSEKYESEWRFSYITLELARTELADHNLSVAESFARKSVDFFFAHNDLANAVGALILHGITHLEMGDKLSAAVCFYNALRNSNVVNTLSATIDALIEIAGLLGEIGEWASAFDILRSVQSHAAITPDARLRIDRVFENINEDLVSKPLGFGNDTDDLQHAISVAIKAETLLH